jgi:hypothetical protein
MFALHTSELFQIIVNLRHTTIQTACVAAEKYSMTVNIRSDRRIFSQRMFPGPFGIETPPFLPPTVILPDTAALFPNSAGEAANVSTPNDNRI